MRRAGSAHFGDLLDPFLQDPEIPKWRSWSTKATFGAISRQLEIDLNESPATLETYWDIIKRFNPRLANIRPHRWADMRDDIRFLLRYAGVPNVPTKSTTPLTEEWQDLLGCLSSYPRSALGRFARFCSKQRISPGDVTDEVADEFRKIVRHESVAKKQDHTYRTFLTHWNKASEEIDGWPDIRLTTSSDSRLWTLPLSAYPLSFQTEVEAWLEWLAIDDPFSEGAPKRPSRPPTKDAKMRAVRYMAGALVVQGRAPRTITGLKDLVEPEACKSALRYIHARRSNSNTNTVYSIARTMHSIAEEWLRLDQEAVDAVQFFCRRLRNPPTQVCDKTCHRIRQLDDKDNLKRLLRFPGSQLEYVNSRDLGRTCDALRVQVALAVELLLMAPVLISKLVRIDFSADIEWLPDGKSIVTIPDGRWESDRFSKFELPNKSTALLDFYLSDYRPRLAPPGNRYLFPGPGDRPREPSNFAELIKRKIHDETGLVINSILFRAIAAKLFLDANPENYEVVRRLLGHRSLSSTIAMYAGAALVAAADRYDREVLRDPQTASHSQRGSR